MNVTDVHKKIREYLPDNTVEQHQLTKDGFWGATKGKRLPEGRVALYAGVGKIPRLHVYT